MIYECDFFHGAVFCKLIKATPRKLEFKKIESSSGSSYVANSSVAFHIKYCSKRLSPWRFTFSYNHHCEIKELKKKFKNVYIILVCNQDGIVCLDYESYLAVIGEIPEGAISWIGTHRKKREMYTIKGQHDNLQSKIGLNSLKEIIECIEAI